MAKKKNTEIDEAMNVFATSEAPEFADRILKIFDNYEALYIDSKGGVFTPDAKPNSDSDAILYQNPYYNKQ